MLPLFGWLTGPARAATTTFVPVADTYTSQLYPDTNYGGASILRTDGSPRSDSFLRFNVRGLVGEVQSAKLRLQATQTKSGAGVTLHGVAENAWGERTVTWRSAPAIGPAVASSGSFVAGQWVEVDARGLVSGNGLVSMALTTPIAGSRRAASREVAADAIPRLVVETSDPPPPPPPPPPLDPPVIAAAGDIACNPASSLFNAGLGTATACRQKYTSDLLFGRELAAVLPLGDIQYEQAQLAQFQTSYDPTWGRFGALARPVVGNHEYKTLGAAGYFDYFNGVGLFGGPAGDRDKGYYSYDIANWHVVALNSNCAIVACGPGSAQEQWLRADLATHPNSCVLAYWHHPRFTSGAHLPATEVSTLWEVLHAAGADVVLNGHDHLYERFGRQNPSGAPDPAAGMRQFTVGTGGKSLYGFKQVARNSGARASRFGVLLLTLEPGGYKWQFLSEGSSTYTDRGSDVCLGPVADTTAPSTPGNLQTTSAAGRNRLTWSASTDNDGVGDYRVLRDGVEIASPPTASFEDASVAPGQSYEYRVVAVDGTGNRSPSSAPATITATTSQLSFAPIEDARIESANPATNYGAATLLKVDATPAQDSLLKFNVSGVGTQPVTSAKLRLRNSNASPLGGEIRATANEWQESTVTWQSAPAAFGGALSSLGPVTAGGWYELDVGAVVTGDGTYSFRLSSLSADGADYSSREASALRPQLVLGLG